MRKSDKKIDNNIRRTLTNACEIALEQVDGFKWLTHFVNYDHFPESLAVLCVFDTQSNLAKARVTKHDDFLISLIVESLLNEGVKLRSASQAVTFDTGEACTHEHGGNWAKRFNQAQSRLGN